MTFTLDELVEIINKAMETERKNRDRFIKTYNDDATAMRERNMACHFYNEGLANLKYTLIAIAQNEERGGN